MEEPGIYNHLIKEGKNEITRLSIKPVSAPQGHNPQPLRLPFSLGGN